MLEPEDKQWNAIAIWRPSATQCRTKLFVKEMVCSKTMVTPFDRCIPGNEHCKKQGPTVRPKQEAPPQRSDTRLNPCGCRNCDDRKQQGVHTFGKRAKRD